MSDEYDKKLRDMQKYVPFLENLIQNLKKSNKHDEKREAQLNKMQMFYELLTNKNKKLKLETLERCEQVLVKLHQKAEKMKLDLPLTVDLPSLKKVETTAKSQNIAVKPTLDKSTGVVSVPQQKAPSKIVKASCSETNSASKLSKTDTKTSIAPGNSGIKPNVVTLPSKNSQKSEIKIDGKTVVDNTKTDAKPSKACAEENQTNAPTAAKQKTKPPNLPKVSEEKKPDAAAGNATESEKSDGTEISLTESTQCMEKSTELEIKSPKEKVDRVPLDPNDKMVATNMTDDWKSTKRKIEPGPSTESDDKLDNCTEDLLDRDTKPDEVIATTLSVAEVEKEGIEKEEEGNESDSACFSVQCAAEANKDTAQDMEQATKAKDDCPKEAPENEPQNVQSQQTVSSSTLKNDPEECSVSSTTIIDPRREKTAEDESDEQNSLQDTVTDSSSNNEAVNKNWIQGALLNLLNPNTIDKSTVLNMLEKVVEGPKFQQIKAILNTEEDKISSVEGENVQNDGSVEITNKVENDEPVDNDEKLDNSVPLAEEKKLTEPKPHTKIRRTELDRLNEDVRFILDTDPENLGPQTKRSCTENKTPNYCEIGPEPKQKPPPKDVEVPAPKPKKKKKKQEVFSYRTRRRSKRKKKMTSKVAALAGIESGADGTESSLGGADIEEEQLGQESLLEELPIPSEEIDGKNVSNADEETLISLPVDISKEELTEEERSFKNIHPEMHSLSKYVSTCAICKFSGRYVTTHYMNSHRMNEMVISRLPPSAQERLTRGEGVDSVFTGKDPFQNRVYQYVCPFCNVKKCYARKIWSQHFGSHTGEYKYKCSGCGYMSVNVRGHIMKYCPGARPIMLENLDRGHDIVAYICKLCNYIQMNREHVLTHIENQHEIMEGIEELITELTLFRSDMKNMQVYNAKKIKIVEVSPKIAPIATKQNAPTAGPSQIKKPTKSAEMEQPSQNEAEELPLVKISSSSKFLIPKTADGQRLKNIYSYMHSQSEYVTRCVLCNYAGKFITKHYVKEHPTSEVFVARIPPERQRCILNNQQLAKLGPVTVVKYKNYYRHSACPFCPVEKSSQRFDWVMHFAIHTGEYKFRCTQCNHYGNARNEFARHFKNGCPNGKLVRLWAHYKYNEEDPVLGYLCKLCNYIQMSRKNVVTHLNEEHGTRADEIREITLFNGNPRYKGRRSVKGGSGKKSKRAKRKIKHVVESGILAVPDFLCEGVVDEEFMAEEGMMDDIPEEDKEHSPLEDDDLVLPMHQMSDDFGNAGFEHLFQMEMDETGIAPVAAEEASRPAPPPPRSREETDVKVDDEQELIRPPEDPIQNIHPEMHSLSPYASKCLLCNFAGKYIAKHYVEEHTNYEVFASRLPPEGQRSLLSGEGSMPIKCVIRSRKMNYFFACPFCNLERDCTRHNWVAHFGIHTGEYKYQCSQCSHRGNASRDFKRHFKGSCRFAQQIRQWPDLVSKEEPILGFYCNLCNYIQLDRGRIVKHLKTQHSCYEPLISKVTMLFIDPKSQMELALADAGPGAIMPPTAGKHKSLKRRFGKYGKKRRPISKMWSTSSQKRAQLQRRTEVEEEAEADVGNEVETSDGEFGEDDGDNNASGGGESEKDADVIEIDESDDEKSPATESSAFVNSYEKIQKFIERTEKKKGLRTLLPKIKTEDKSEPTAKHQIPLPFEAPTKDRPLTNIHPEMHSQSVYAKKCILCPFVGRHLINHYISFHPRFEVPISRLPPTSQELIAANKNNVALEIESNPYSPKLFSHICMFCGTEFTFTIKSWVDHIGTHTGEYNFKCSECGRMINSKHDIHEHIKHFCRKGKALARQFPVTDRQQLLAYICRLCNFVQMNRGNILQHLRGQHKVPASMGQVMEIMLLRFDKSGDSKAGTKLLVPKKEDRIKVENLRPDTKYTTREYVKVEQSDAIYEILVPETELKVPSETPSTSAKVKTEPGTDLSRPTTRHSFHGGLQPIKRPQATIVNQRPGGTSITIRRSAPPSSGQPAPLSTKAASSMLAGSETIQRISHLGYSLAPDGTTKYHCCVRSCTFTATAVPITLATHIMDDHASLIWEGYCRECQGHVATGKNMKLTKEIQHLFEHTRKRPGSIDPKEDQLLTPPSKMPRLSGVTPLNPTGGKSGAAPAAPDDSADQIIARFANNKSITITREVKPASPDGAPSIMHSIPFPPQNAATSKQEQVLKEVKRTALKPWTVSKSVKAENTIISLLSDIALFAFFKCMGNDCQFTTNDSNKMAEHLALHSEIAKKEINTDQPGASNVFSWLECCYCSTWAGTVMQLIAHITAKHSRDIYQCPYCFYRSCEEYNVVVHEKHYHNEQRLSILFCFGRRLLKPGGDLAIHTVKRIRCSKCPCTFMNPLAFATHVAEYTDIDLGGDIYKCYYCSKKHTKSIIEFARHIVEHRPVRKADAYRCYQCFKKQAQLNQLPNKHNTKSYQCVHCAFSTDDENQMGLHMAQVHASNLLFCGLRIRITNMQATEESANRLDNGAAFVLLKKPVDNALLYKCPYTPTQLNYLSTAIEPLPQEYECEDENMDSGSCSSPVITQNPGGLQIAQVQSISDTQFASLITIDDDDDD